MSRDDLIAARNAVAVVFICNGLAMASLMSRVPTIRADLALTNTALGLLLLTVAVGSITSLASSGPMVARFGAERVVRVGAVAVAVGLIVAGLGASTMSSVPCTAAGLVLFGLGSGAWDVAMNVEAAEVERGLERAIMPRFHAGWSLGSVAGAGVGVLAIGLDVSVLAHVATIGLVAAVVALPAAGWFRPAGHGSDGDIDLPRGKAWTDPRTLAIGVMVLTFAAAEGAANDWLALSIVDGYDAADWVGVAGFTAFVTAMTIGRFVGPPLLDMWGRVAVLTSACAATISGVLIVVGSPFVPGGLVLAAGGILLWGLGTSLGFPVGMSAAADDPLNAGARVSVVSTIGYGAFLTGPPLLGALGDAVGTLPAMLAVPALMLVGLAMVPALRVR